MPMASGPDRYLVVGNPIADSRSPEIHAAFAAQTGQHILYERRLIETDPPEAFAAAMRHFFQGEGGQGANVTLPFKEAAFRLADERSPRAEAAGAANTLCFIEGRIIADNTDGAGLVDDIQRRLGVSLKGVRVTVLGAGGAARGLMLPLAQAGVARLVVANRTLARAQALAADIDPHLEAQALPVRVEPVALADAPAADVLINATSAGLHGDGPTLPVVRGLPAGLRLHLCRPAHALHAAGHGGRGVTGQRRPGHAGRPGRRKLPPVAWRPARCRPRAGSTAHGTLIALTSRIAC